MFACSLCEIETCYISKFCDKCRRIKHYLNLYNDRVYEVLDSVLSRVVEKQEKKISEEIKNEIVNKEYNLRQKKKDQKDIK